MPFLDARALETDPEGLAFLRSVVGTRMVEVADDGSGAVVAPLAR